LLERIRDLNLTLLSVICDCSCPSKFENENEETK
jgi:hypothetical protein